jgi:thioester reductase-like protein
VLEGDTEAPQLGLSGEQWQHAAHEVTHLVHAAALVKMTLPLEVAQRAAVSAVENVLALAWQARGHRLKKVELVSTVGVGGRQSQALAETWLEHPRDFHNTYEAAKAEAEVVARRALEAGLPLTVVRPSMVVGDSRSGKVRARQIFSYLCEFLTGTRVHGLFPPLQQARLDTVPVDWVCALLLQSSRTPAWVGRVLHACSADASVSLIELRERVQRIARAHHRPVVHRATLPLVAFRAAARLGKLVGGERGRKAGQLLGILLSYLEDQQRFSNHQTLALAAEVGLTLPDPRSYLDAVLEADFSRL